MNTTEQLSTALIARERFAPDPDELRRAVRTHRRRRTPTHPSFSTAGPGDDGGCRPCMLAAVVVAVVTTAVVVAHANRQPEPTSHPAPRTDLATTSRQASPTPSSAHLSAIQGSTDPLAIVGRDWLVVAATRNGVALDLDPKVPFVVRFDGKGGTTGKDGCNTFRGTADVGQGTMRVGDSMEVTTIGCQASNVPFGGDLQWYLDGIGLHLNGDHASLLLHDANTASTSPKSAVGSASIPTCGRIWSSSAESSRLKAVATWPSTLQINQSVTVGAELTNTGTSAISGSYTWELVLLDSRGVVVADLPKATLDLQKVSIAAGHTTHVQAHATTLIPCRAGALKIGAQYTAFYLARIDTIARTAVSEPRLVTISG